MTHFADARLDQIERQYSRLAKLFWIATVTLLLSVVVLFFRSSAIAVAEASGTKEILRVKGLVIVDDNGVERVWIGAPLPGQIVKGKREQRPHPQAGVLLYDTSGIERAGYVTDDKSGNAFLSLDDRTQQEAVFVTDPNHGTVLRMWHGDDSLELRLDPDENGPSLKLVRDKKTVYQQPAP
jgi:hypothetical protein